MLARDVAGGHVVEHSVDVALAGPLTVVQRMLTAARPLWARITVTHCSDSGRFSPLGKSHANAREAKMTAAHPSAPIETTLVTYSRFLVSLVYCDRFFPHLKQTSSPNQIGERG